MTPELTLPVMTSKPHQREDVWSISPLHTVGLQWLCARTHDTPATRENSCESILKTALMMPHVFFLPHTDDFSLNGRKKRHSCEPYPLSSSPPDGKLGTVTKLASDAPAYCLQSSMDLELKRGVPCDDTLRSLITGNWGCEKGQPRAFKGSACNLTRSSRSPSTFCITFCISFFSSSKTLDRY
ncbi:hypothetical protein TNCV_16981 [Trichonephila clavipes]|nr:hypothetical protein TNCV_16981 [Trichonephila clavipes]